MTKRLFLLPLLLALGFSACGGTREAGGDDNKSGGIDVETDVDASSSAGNTSSDVSSESSEEDSGDVGTNSNIDPDGKQEEEGCKGVDFLIVVDNSGSMGDEQQNLAASFPNFLATLQETLGDDANEFHVMVMDTDSDRCEAQCMSEPDGICGGRNGMQCKDIPPLDPNNCDVALGAGRVTDGSGTSCNIDGPQRFIISDSQMNIDQTFACLGRQGTEGSGFEKPMDALTSALSDDFLGKNGCNEGFIREDAILVVMLITDEEDDIPTDGEPPGSAGEPDDWYDAVLAAKGGDEKAIMAVGLIGDDKDTSPRTCEPFNQFTGAEISPRLHTFIKNFGDNGVAGSVCAEDYNPFLKELVSKIESSCDTWIPPV